MSQSNQSFEFSILVLTHNHLDKVTTFVNGIERVLQSFDVELVMLDNGSTDGTAKFVRDLPMLIRSRVKPVSILLPENIGVAAGRQRLVEESHGHILIFLDSDVVVQDANFVNVIRNEFMKDEQLGALGAAGSKIKPDHYNRTVDFWPALPGVCDVVSGFCFAVPADLFEAVAFDAEYGIRWEEDADLCMQVWDAKFSVKWSPELCQMVAHIPTGDMADVVDREVTLRRFYDKWCVR